MRLPLAVDGLRHLGHAPGHNFCVKAIVGKVRHVVTVGTALLGCDPEGHGHHEPVELIDGEVAEHLNVFVDILGQGATGLSWAQGLWRLVGRHELGLGSRVHHLLHARAAVADLIDIHRGTFAACEQEGEAHPRQKRTREMCGNHGRLLYCAGATAGIAAGAVTGRAGSITGPQMAG